MQRDWCHKLANVLDKLPKRLRPREAGAARHHVCPVKADAERGIDAFVAEFEAKYPKVAACLAEDREALLGFFGFPAEHWLHLRTSNVIESVFATVRLRPRVTKGAGSRTKGLLMAYKLVAMAQRRWRRLNGAHLLPLVRDGVDFVDGVIQTGSLTGRIGRRPPDHVNGRSPGGPGWFPTSGSHRSVRARLPHTAPRFMDSLP